jgi:hypothetical protein
MIRFALIALAVSLAWPAAAQNAPKTKKQQTENTAKAAAGARELGTFGAWGAYQGAGDGGKVCFVLSQPKERQPAGLNRDPSYLFISFRPTAGVRNEVALITGYAVKEGTQPTAQIGNATFGLVAKEEKAWLQNAAEEGQFVQQAKSGSTLLVRGTSRRGNNLIDRFSLQGLGQAIEAAQKGCR